MNRSEIPKKDKLLGLFNKIGIQHPVKYVLEHTGMETEHSLRTVMCDYRRNGVANLRMKFGFIERVEWEEK